MSAHGALRRLPTGRVGVVIPPPTALQRSPDVGRYEKSDPGGRAPEPCEFGQHWGVISTRCAGACRRGVWSPGLNRFAWAQCFSGAAGAMVAVSAGSLFFSLSPEASRQQILFYLVINLAPYVLMAPLVEACHRPTPARTAQHRRLPVALRAVCAAGLALTLLDLGFYFFALALLIAAKATGVTRQALTGLVDDGSQLVAANCAWHVST